MFKLESYITPLLLSYVDKYIKNFRAEDSQVSLWGGDVSFNNLDLRLEVLENELQLPFTFVSGHIHELLIHVPWTKITTEPITITINTIECILKLKGPESIASGTSKDKKRNKIKHEEVEAAPGYIQSVINKIVGNIRLYCNNLILKYVEDDIVLSMNIKLLTFESANNKWEPAYTDIPHGEVTLRKLINLNDLTICLDKRNSSGKIEIYQEPVLYRCSMTVRLLRSYYSPTVKKTSVTRADIHCTNMEFSMNEQQVPMVMRIIHLIIFLIRREYKQETEFATEPSSVLLDELTEDKLTWAGWAWSVLPSVFPSNWDGEYKQEITLQGHTFHFGFYVDNASLTLKVSECSQERGYYNQKKMKYWPILYLNIQGVFYELVHHGKTWSNSTFGISEVLLFPVGFCTCSYSDVIDPENSKEYFKAGSRSDKHLLNSLFDEHAPENCNEKRKYTISWEQHMNTKTITYMLDASPACALDFVHHIQLPDDMTMSTLNVSQDIINFHEDYLVRIVVGHLRLNLCSGFFHRLSTFMAAMSAYDYQPYTTPKPPRLFHELQPPSEDDFEAFNERITMKMIEVTVINPVIELELADHPYFKASKECYFRPRKRTSVTSLYTPDVGSKYLPKLTLECQCLTANFTSPLYEAKLVSTTCQLPDPPTNMFNACHREKNIKINGICSRLILGCNNKYTTIVTPTNATYYTKSIINPEYWLSDDVIHETVLISSEAISFTGTNPKLTLAIHILRRLFKTRRDEYDNYIRNSSLFEDASRDFSMPYLEFCLESVDYKMIRTNMMRAFEIQIGSLKSFIYNPIDITCDSTMSTATNETISNNRDSLYYATRDIEQVLFITSSDKDSNASKDFITITIQLPITPDRQSHPAIVIFNVEELKICFDPLFCKWLLYTPTVTLQKTELAGGNLAETYNRKLKNTSDISLMETPRKLITTHESVHSSSDREHVIKQKVIPMHKEEATIDIQERIYNFLKKWFNVWKDLILYGDINQCVIHFPIESLSAVGFKGMQQTINQAVTSDKPPEILVITLPKTSIKCNGNKKIVMEHISNLPITLPDNIWHVGVYSFPWTISITDLCIYTLQYGKKLNVLKPTSISATVALSTNESKTPEEASKETVQHQNQTSINIETFGLCVYIDISPIHMFFSEVQIYLLASILYGLTEVTFNRISSVSAHHLKRKDRSTETASRVSPVIFGNTSREESTSENNVSDNLKFENSDRETQKLTAWVQSTINKLTITILSHRQKKKMKLYKEVPHIKLVFDAEDIVTSLDFQNVYLKVKSKIGSASIKHFTKKTTGMRFVKGPFLGIIMQARESVQDKTQDDTCFATMTITRANCKHTHNLWGTSKKNKKENISTPSRFLTEIVFTLQPIDFILPPSVLVEFLTVFQPLTQIKNTLSKSKRKYEHKFKVNNGTLPLTYFELKGFQFIFPTDKDACIHDMAILQIDNIMLNPNPENPICRIPKRADLYEKAAQARLLHIPGSDLEDRQYQLDINKISFSTGRWKDLQKLLENLDTDTPLKTMSENPALEWNNLGNESKLKHPHFRLWPFIEKFDLMIIAAPAMVYESIVICNHSIEVNFVSDIDFNLCLSHFELLTILLQEMKSVYKVFGSKEYIHPQVVFPYESFYFLPATVFDETASIDTKDSGIDAEVKSNTSLRDYSYSDTSRVHILQETEKLIRVVSKPILFAVNEPKVSMEVLITAGKISLIISQLIPHDLQTDDSTSRPKNIFDLRTKSIILDSITTLEPILFVALSQPNCYMSDTELGQRIQLSCFDVCVKINGPEIEPIHVLPTEKDFSINILETRPGIPDIETGIFPSLCTIKWIKGPTKLSTLDIQLTKPIKVLFSMDRIERFIMIYHKLMLEFLDSTSEVEPIDIEEEIIEELGLLGVRERRLRFYDQYERFKEIKRILLGLSFINVEVSQIVVAVKTSKDIELTMSIGELNHNITINNRPERVTFVLKYDYLTLAISQGAWKKLLLNPWSLSTELILFWEPWQDEDSDPQIQVAIESDTILIDISSHQIRSINVFINEITAFVLRYVTGDIAITAPIKTCINESNQYYKDDLRAGAFQFVDAQTNNVNELPLPYQVVFWNKNASIMAWRYPQPRVLTKVRVFPVPFKVTTNDAPTSQILCHLEYWSDCYNSYQPYTKFYLSETEMCHLELPINEPKPIIACTWRVLLMSVTVNEDNIKTYSSTRVPISPHVLAGCIRIDSYFSRALVPDLIILMNIASINVSLYSSIDKDNYTMPDGLKEYNCDMALPENQCFLTLHLQNVKAYVSSWNLESMMLDCTMDISTTILDYTFLSNLTLIEPFKARIQFSYANQISCNFASKPIRLRFGASTAHTLFVSTQLWNQKIYANPEAAHELVIVTPYVICNNCNIPLKFGQTGYEEIYLPTRYCHLYAWRSQKCKKMLRVAIEDDNFWVWSEPFCIDKEGTQMLKLSEQNITVIVTVKALSTTQYRVTFSGQFCIYNMLSEHFEFKVVEAVADKDAAFKNAQRYIINGKSSPPTILLSTKTNYHLRIRFFGLDSAWSGDIPLHENTKSPQPWLVKVPLQERGQFLSIWCKMFVQHYPKGSKILAVLWPLFMIRSNLPVNSKIQIETPTLNVQLESTINGKGEHQQLYCPGTIDHSHQITLQLDNNATTLNPYVPLNYSLVDQRLFFKRLDNYKIDDIIDVIKNFDVSEWPYFGEDLSLDEYVIGDQPLTHVQVKYENACLYSSTLLVELLPWCLLLNTLGCQIGIVINAQEICRVDHYGLVTPPKLEETFHIGVGLGKTWNMSLPLQMANSDWGQVFYMPKITGTIPLDGYIKTVVKCEPYICSMLLQSCLKNEIRLLRVCSTHIITNYLDKKIHVVCLAITNGQAPYKVPSKLENHSFEIVSNLDLKNTGISIVQWYAIGNNIDSIEQQTELALYVSVSLNPLYGWSCPVRVDKNLTRRSVCVLTQNYTPFPIVLTCTELDGQSVLSIHQDNHPQLEIRNNSGIRLFFAQCDKFDKTIVIDSEHFNWICNVESGRKVYYTLPLVSSKFPEIHSQVSNDFIVIASDPEGDPQGYQWSNPINITVLEQFVRIPFLGDVKIISEAETHTIVLNIESVSQTEINARDIRVRLSQHEKEMVTSETRTNSIKSVSEYEVRTINARESRSNTSMTSSYCTAHEEQIVDVVQTVSREESKFYRYTYMNLLANDISIDSPISLDTYDSISEFKVKIYVESIIFTLTNDLENGGVERTEIASLTCDNVAFKIVGRDVSDITLCVNEIQLDNQMYHTGSYDFSVVLIGQNVKKSDTDLSIHSPIQNLIERTSANPLFKIEMTLERLRNIYSKTTTTCFKDVNVCIKPIALYIEDTYMIKLLDHLTKMLPTNLIVWSKENVASVPLIESRVRLSPAIILVSSMLANPLILSSLCIEQLSLSLSVHSSKKLYIALDQSPLQFSQFERKSILTTPYRLGHTLTMHYLSGAIFGAGWVVGSLELLGSPGALARAMGTGLKDFVSMPCYGLIQGPWAFLKGVTHGSASLMKHVTAGTLQSVTKLASSVARNLDRLTLDEEHLRRTEEQRRQKPQGFTQGFLQGLTGLGISLLGAVGGIAHHPLQSIVSDGPSTSNLITGVGLGIVGIFTKPLSGAADLVALTGQGLLQGAGWNTLPQPRINPMSIHMYSSQNTVLKYIWKYGLTNMLPEIIYATEATCISNGQYESVALILMLDNLVIANLDEDMPQKTLKLSELRCSDVTIDPTLITLKLKIVQVEEKDRTEIDDDDVVIEMDPASRARVVDYVKSTTGLLHFPEHLENCDDITNLFDNTEECLSFYVNPINRNYFISLLEICKQQKMKYNFPIY